MNILLIGNGFDLAHKLPTKYTDFLDFIKVIYIKKDSVMQIVDMAMAESYPNLNPLIRRWFAEKNTTSESRYDLQRMQELVSNNIWVEYFLDKVADDGDRWVDFEGEILEVIKSLDYMKRIRGKKELNHHDLKKYELEKKLIRIIENANLYSNISLEGKRIKIDVNNLNEQEYYNNIIKYLQGDLLRLIKCLEIYLVYCMDSKSIEERTTDIAELSIDKVVSFNYTDTFRLLYATNINSIEYDFIHGKVGDKDKFSFNIQDNNMVLGIDEYLDDSRKNIDVDYIQFKKYFQRIHKETGCKYKMWIKEMQEDDEKKYNEIISIQPKADKEMTRKLCLRHNLYIFGHSLDVTDKDILKELILNENVITTIFYLNKQVYAQQIANLVKVIGQDELIKRVSGPNKTIIFKKQQDMIPIE
ncbi:AbiH family protein [Cellulosilyticum lentocellum]|uniref:Bacteriophage abortive infection AbiH n=1 Tax=Cellulosilyticum lentocellum (strain ATCC 49066 / DSM 5427 / NCIMB 11756 / RHM5) TaxID=642492 RepID=F2JSV2_CELLD|nr:AbiH family protein [Cellulosilyticum lentocellum]ADZ84073.1 hypothetical protein Clole_2366 [Cellulosilyticum lentocellum DSM 5427]